jgi:hypothetical protein
MFLSSKDDTECYPVSKCGSGVFSIDYIQKAAKTDSLNELEMKYNSGSENGSAANDIFYKICALHVEKDFLHDAGI